MSPNVRQPQRRPFVVHRRAEKVHLCGIALLLCAAMNACGNTTGARHEAPGTHRNVRLPSTPASGYLNDGDHDTIGDADNDNTYDNDNDNPEDHAFDDNGSYRDSDDSGVVAFGREAASAERLAVAKLVKRYHATAMDGDGGAACSMLLPSFARAVPQTYAQGNGPAYLYGRKTCSQVLTALFQHQHSQLASPLAITGVRIQGNQAIALLGSNTAPASYISLRRAAGAWWIDALISEPLP